MNIQVLASGSSGNCYWVSDSETHLLIEAGIARKKIGEYIHRHQLPGVDACLLSHGHQDHSRCVKDLLRMGIDTCMSEGTAEALGISDRIQILNAGHSVVIASWDVTAFKIEHDAPDPLGFILQSSHTGERLCYATDTMFIPPHYGDGCTHLMLEANYSLDKIKDNVQSGDVDRAVKHRVLWNHQSIETVLKFLRETDRSRLREVVLLHLSDANSDEVEFRKAVAEIVGVPVRVA
jgi:phosphoribosyl 1,2-cyclic phosphodiesterase